MEVDNILSQSKPNKHINSISLIIYKIYMSRFVDKSNKIVGIIAKCSKFM